MEKENKNVIEKKIPCMERGHFFFISSSGISEILEQKKKQAATVKMLTQDGRLVEIDVANIPSQKKKIKTADIHTWINKKTSL